MKAGSLNRRVTIKARSVGQDATGQPVEAWQDVASVWASVRHLSGLESLKADRESSTVRASIRIRYRAGIDAGMRVHQGSSVYDIRAVLPDEVRREFMDLSCERVL